MRSRWAARFPRRTSRNERPSIRPAPVPVGGGVPPAASTSVGRRSTQLTIASVRVPGFTTPGPGDDQRHANAGVVEVPLAERPLRAVIARHHEERALAEMGARGVVDRAQVVVGLGHRVVVAGAEGPRDRRVDEGGRDVDRRGIVGAGRLRPGPVRPLRADEQEQRLRRPSRRVPPGRLVAASIPR